MRKRSKRKQKKTPKCTPARLKLREQEVKTLTLEVLELEKSWAANKQQLTDYVASTALMHESLQLAEQENIATTALDSNLRPMTWQSDGHITIVQRRKRRRE